MLLNAGRKLLQVQDANLMDGGSNKNYANDIIISRKLKAEIYLETAHGQNLEGTRRLAYAF